MANAPVEAINLPTGMGTLTLKLYPSGSDSIANGASGDDVAESTNRKGHYSWTVTEGLSGIHTAHIFTSGGDFVGGGYVNMDDTTRIHRIGHSAALLAEVLAEPSAVPAWATSTFGQWLAWLGAWSRNKVTSTSTTQTLRNDADNASIATITQSDDGTTFTSGEAS